MNVPTDPDVKFTLPGVPRALQRNRHRIVTTKDKRQFVANYLPAQSRAEQGAVKLFAQQAMHGTPPIDGPVEMRMTAFMPVPASWSQKKRLAALTGEIRPTSKPDLSNVTKQIEDGMRQVCYRDDSQIVALHVWKFFSDTPRVVVELRRVVLAAPLPAERVAQRDLRDNLPETAFSLLSDNQ